MAHIRFDGSDYETLPGESVLEVLERADIEIPNACRSGVCQSCIMRVRAGNIPPGSQTGLKDTLREQGYFLACQCKPDNDMEITLPAEDARGEIPVQVASVDMLSQSVMRVMLKPEQEFQYRRGQFINLIREDGLRRSYSLAGCSKTGELLELHVRYIPGGAMSEWLLQAGMRQRMCLQGPHGNCFYIGGSAEQPMLMIGTGTGLAPLHGIVCEALAAGHTGPIHLYHGALNVDGLYLVDHFRDLAIQYPNLHYTPCVRDPESRSSTAEFTIGSVDDVGFGQHMNLKGWKSYFCGNPDIVNRMRKRAYLAGASLADIYTDAFLPAATKSIS